MDKHLFVRTLLCLSLFLITLSLAAQERFTRWHAEITPGPDRGLHVTETLTVVSEGDAVKRGITRSLPAGPHPLEVVAVSRDGRKSPYHTRSRGGTLTIYAGDKKRRLDPGTYTYTITYTLGRVVDREGDLDELQFEVIGPDVELPVENVGATVVLPDGLRPAQYACYTGATGERDRNCTIAAPADGRLTYSGRGDFGRGEQLSLAVGFAPGWFDAPSEANTVQPPPPPTWFEREGSLLLLLMLALGGGYYAYTTWRRHGVDPPAPPVGRVHTAPGGLSPAATAYLNTWAGGSGARGFTASLLALATRGDLRIKEREEKGLLSTDYRYTLERVGAPPAGADVPPEQRLLLDRLFAKSDTYALKDSYDKELHEVMQAHDEQLEGQHGELRGRGANVRFIWPLLGIVLLSLVPAVIYAKHATWPYAIPFTLVYASVAILGFVAYTWLIRRPDPALVRLRAEINALKEYLELPKERRKRIPNLPPMTEAHYEELLPYAIALGINRSWTGYFESAFTPRNHYAPYWVVGHGGFDAGRFDRQFNQAVGTVTTNPQSASGGGGAVGGGAGGGGAGGW